jgi:hypothetical protein
MLDTFTDDDLLAVRQELAKAKRSADTVNHYRRVVRGIFGTHRSSPALAWAWMALKVESEGKLQFYTPAQVRKQGPASAVGPDDSQRPFGARPVL